MGQKVNPHGLRVGIIKDWDSRWYAEDAFADNLVEDDKIRKYVKKRLYNAGISKIEIERASDRVKLIVYTAKPGVVIGKGGSSIEELKKDLQKMTDKKDLQKRSYWNMYFAKTLFFRRKINELTFHCSCYKN